MLTTPRVAVLTVSDRSHLALEPDESGPAASAIVLSWGWRVEAREVVPDEPEAIASLLTRWADESGVDLILTSGGTGLSFRDVTPEATAGVADRLVPGISEWLRAASGRQNPHAFLSRGLAACRGRTLIINLPGSPRAVRECLALLAPVLPHALEQLRAGGGWDSRRVHPRPADRDSGSAPQDLS